MKFSSHQIIFNSNRNFVFQNLPQIVAKIRSKTTFYAIFNLKACKQFDDFPHKKLRFHKKSRVTETMLQKIFSSAVFVKIYCRNFMLQARTFSLLRNFPRWFHFSGIFLCVSFFKMLSRVKSKINDWTIKLISNKKMYFFDFNFDKKSPTGEKVRKKIFLFVVAKFSFFALKSSWSISRDVNQTLCKSIKVDSVEKFRLVSLRTSLKRTFASSSTTS